MTPEVFSLRGGRRDEGERGAALRFKLSTGVIFFRSPHPPRASKKKKNSSVLALVAGAFCQDANLGRRGLQAVGGFGGGAAAASAAASGGGFPWGWGGVSFFFFCFFSRKTSSSLFCLTHTTAPSTSRKQQNAGLLPCIWLRGPVGMGRRLGRRLGRLGRRRQRRERGRGRLKRKRKGPTRFSLAFLTFLSS